MKLAFARRTDEGRSWTKPRIIAGPKKPGNGYIASWGYPLVSKSGRIYVLYSQHIGKHDNLVLLCALCVLCVRLPAQDLSRMGFRLPQPPIFCAPSQQRAQKLWH